MSNVTSTGGGLSAGSGTMLTLTPRALTARGGGVSSGSARISTKLPAGGLSDFSIWDNAADDGAKTQCLAYFRPTDSTTSWVRPWVAITAPTAYDRGAGPLWNRAAYAALGFIFRGMAQNKIHYFTDAQFEVAQINNLLSEDATAYTGRLCYAGYAGGAVLTRTTEQAYVGRYAGKLSFTQPSAIVGNPTINPTDKAMVAALAGDILIASLAMSTTRAGAQWSAAVVFYDSAFTQVGLPLFTSLSTHPGSQLWQVSTAKVTVPVGAVWSAVVPYFVGSTLAVGDVAYIDMHRLRKYNYNLDLAPSAFTPPRQSIITLRAVRVNYVLNPSFDTEVWGWRAIYPGQVANPFTRDAIAGRVRGGSAKFAMAAFGTTGSPGEDYGEGTYGTGAYGHAFYGIGTVVDQAPNALGITDLHPNTTYIASGYVKVAPGQPAVRMRVYPGTYLTSLDFVESPSTTDVQINNPEQVEGDWIRLSTQFTTTDDFNGILELRFVVAQKDMVSSGATFWVDDVVVEEGTLLQPYFDGNTPGEDFWWEGGVVARARSHYYPGTRGSLYRLQQLIGDWLPLGKSSTFLYAQPPN